METDTLCIVLIGIGLFADAVAIVFGLLEGRNIRRAVDGRAFFEDQTSEAAHAEQGRVDTLVAKHAARAGDWRIVGWCGLGIAALGVFIGVALRV